MAKPFDATLNALIDAHVADWADFLAARAGVPVGPAEVLDTDLSSTLQADRLFRIGGQTPYALHLELESSSRLGISEELLRYNVAARKSASLPVNSVLVLLRPKALASDLTGVLELPDPNGVTYLTFRYTVVRLWEESFDAVLNAGLGLAPLALLTNEASADLPKAVTRFHERLQRETIPVNVTKELLGFTSVLGGLRYEVEPFRRLLMQGRNILEDSTTYKWIMEQGHEKGMAQGKLRRLSASY